MPMMSWRPFLLWVAILHVTIAWFTATPGGTAIPAHPLWVIPFAVAAAACVSAAITEARSARDFAGVATIVAYASRALAFPFAAWSGIDVPGSSWFGTALWTLMLVYALRTFRG